MSAKRIDHFFVPAEMRLFEWTANAVAQLYPNAGRVSDLVRGKKDKFSLDMLIALAACAGKRVELGVLR